MNRLSVLALAAVLGSPAAALAQSSDFTAEEQSLANAEMIDAEGQALGTVAFVETPSGLLIQPRLENLPEGTHAIHIHDTGQCEPPEFESAGDHLNPAGSQHGYLNENGPHAGDLPNIHIGSDGRLEDHILTEKVALTSGDSPLFPRDEGAAIVIHESPDDYQTDPSGASGARIACGVIVLRAAESAEAGGAGTEGQTQQ